MDDVDVGFQWSYERREWIDLAKTSLPALLHSEDRMPMSKSVEMRVPFLDHRLVELLARVHPSEKLENGWTKSIFRRAIKGWVPEEIGLRRDKKGFNLPVDDWMRGALRERTASLFASDMLSEQLGFVNPRDLSRLYASFCRGQGSLNGRQFFRAYALEIFLRRFETSIATS